MLLNFVTLVGLSFVSFRSRNENGKQKFSGKDDIVLSRLEKGNLIPILEPLNDDTVYHFEPAKMHGFSFLFNF